MSLDIFRLDWILIDTIIIVLLLLLLFSVKIFKEISRWRFSLSNESLKRVDLKNLEFNTSTSGLIMKHCSVITNKMTKNEGSSKVVVILNTKSFKRNLFRILTEGLSTYGFDVVRIDIKIKSGKSDDNPEQDKEISVREVISKIIKQSEQEKLISSSNYVVIHYSETLLQDISLLSDVNNTGIIVINPKIKNKSLTIFSNLFDRTYKLYLIFSKKSHLIFNNYSLKKLLKENPHYNKLGIQLTIIEKSRKSFKYYETILLGTILNIFEIKNKKSPLL